MGSPNQDRGPGSAGRPEVLDAAFTDRDPPSGRSFPMSPGHLLSLMRERVKVYGSPLPEGFVAPPGIDINELLKQLPPPPPRPDTPPTA